MIYVNKDPIYFASVESEKILEEEIRQYIIKMKNIQQLLDEIPIGTNIWKTEEGFYISNNNIEYSEYEEIEKLYPTLEEALTEYLKWINNPGN